MSRFDPFWNTVCDHDHLVSFGLMTTIMLFVMAVISLLLVQPGTANFYITIFNVVLILAMAGPLAYAHRRCAMREMRAYEIDTGDGGAADEAPVAVEGRGIAATPVEAAAASAEGGTDEAPLENEADESAGKGADDESAGDGADDPSVDDGADDESAGDGADDA